MGVEVTEGLDELAGVVKRIKELSQVVTIGLHEDAAPYPDGTSVVVVGIAQEFGLGPMEPRPYIRGYFDSGGAKELGDEAKSVAGSVIDGAATPLALGDAVGTVGVNGVRGYIEAGIEPALSSETRDKPGRDPRGIPLLDTGHLTGQIGRKVEAT